MTVQTLDSVAHCYVYSLALTDFLIPTISTKQVHPPTWASPLSDPLSMTSTRGHLPTWASLVSVSVYHLPTQTSSLFRLRSYYNPIYSPLILLLLASCESSRVARIFFIASWRHHAFLLRSPLLYPVSLAHTSNKGRHATHCARVACCCSI